MMTRYNKIKKLSRTTKIQSIKQILRPEVTANQTVNRTAYPPRCAGILKCHRLNLAQAIRATLSLPRIAADALENSCYVYSF
jgi:hypothetical protein